MVKQILLNILENNNNVEYIINQYRIKNRIS
jgi:hypothetical protein